MKRSGYTLIELLAVIFVMTAPVVIFKFVAATLGPLSGIGAAFSGGALSIIAVIQFYRWMDRLDERGLQKARDEYHEIYRVIAIPCDPSVIVMAESAEIRVGDYGWEAGPSRNDGLIYLQGMTLDWTVVWHAGLPPDEIEKVGTKPYSQYDSWYPYWANPPRLPPCPFPVVERETMTIGRPHHGHRYCVQPSLYRPRPTTPKGKDCETD